MSNILSEYKSPNWNNVYTYGSKQDGYEEILNFNVWVKQFNDYNIEKSFNHIKSIGVDDNKLNNIRVLQEFLDEANNAGATHFKLWVHMQDEYVPDTIEITATKLEHKEIPEQQLHINYNKYIEKIDSSNMYLWKQFQCDKETYLKLHKIFGNN